MHPGLIRDTVALVLDLYPTPHPASSTQLTPSPPASQEPGLREDSWGSPGGATWSHPGFSRKMVLEGQSTGFLQVLEKSACLEDRILVVSGDKQGWVSVCGQRWQLIRLRSKDSHSCFGWSSGGGRAVASQQQVLWGAEVPQQQKC